MAFSETQILKEGSLGTGEMAQWLRVLEAFEEDLGSVPSTYVATDSHPVLGTQIPSSDALQACT